MTVKAQGVTFGNRQGLLQFIAGRKPEELTTYLKRDRANTFQKAVCRLCTAGGKEAFEHQGFLCVCWGIDQRNARRFVKANGFDVSIGAKMFVDRVRFDEWCTGQNRQGKR